MNTQQVTVLLKECLRLLKAKEGAKEPAEKAREDFLKCKADLPKELNSLLQEAADMKWPFVVEKWQYKRSVTSEDKVNTSDLINRHLLQLLEYLKASISAGESVWAASAVFLVDRFLYMIDSSHTLLRIAKALHKRYPETPIAPQVVIRRARVYLNTGKLQTAEYILSSLISNSGETGCWRYANESDQTLVQAVSVQVRGQVLQKLGLWLEAAELIWASLIGFYVLPQPDKKSFLGQTTHRLLTAAEAAKMAVVYSQYVSLFVLTNVVTQGTCLLSYSFSQDCPPSEKQTYLAQAKEAFEIGLLTRTKADAVTSKQELHTFLKAAYCLTVTHKWMGDTSPELVNEAIETCQGAMEDFYTYCFRESLDQSHLCPKIMDRVHRVKEILEVKPYPNSDEQSFIPDSYRAVEERVVPFKPADFSKMLVTFKKHHETVSQAFRTTCRESLQAGGEGRILGPCVTAFETSTESLPTECLSDSAGTSADQQTNRVAQNCSAENGPRRPQTLPTTVITEDVFTQSLSSKNMDHQPTPEMEQQGKAEQSRSAENKPCQSQALISTVFTEDEPQRLSSKDMDRRGPSTNVKVTKSRESSDSNESYDLNSSWEKVPSVNNDNENKNENFMVSQTCPTLASLEDDQENPQERTNLGHFTGPVYDTSPETLKEHSSPKPSSQVVTSSQAKNNIPESSNGPHLDQSGVETELESEFSDWSLVEGSQTSPESLSSSFGSSSSWQKLHLTESRTSVSDGENPESHSNPVPKQNTKGTRQNETGSLFHTQAQGLASPSGTPKEPCQESRSQGHKSMLSSTMPGSYEMVELDDKALVCENPATPSVVVDSCDVKSCSVCFEGCEMGSEVLTEEDYKYLLAGVCQDCLIKRLPKKAFQLKTDNKAYRALTLKYSKATDIWIGCQTIIFIGEKLGMKGSHRTALWVQYLHQESLLSSYVGKEYIKTQNIEVHLSDVERQMTAQYYVTEFNKRLYEKNEATQIFFIPSELLLVLERNSNGNDVILGCVSVEPYMLGEFKKLTNNTRNKTDHMATDYGIAFGHFNYEFSTHQEVVVDLQGWITANGLTYMTDPQIHSLRKPPSKTNFHQKGIDLFLREQHGRECNHICRSLGLRPLLEQLQDVQH
ncbi:alpha-protein kinase 1 isoform X2 [Chanos chanos]|uniref:Alpha-protein kinase 1 isoform X2 n=1 Tax=Chanos chanos TaxID=29144 RepID=A0A6J2VX27_CHACN|nr:alpha-protein kinase 1 isoform X2 [Chanos chanos]